MPNHLFIVTYGRTGSTLLMGILNAHPKIRIAGENAGLAQDLYRALDTLGIYEGHLKTMDTDTVHNPYFGASRFPFGPVREQISNLFDHLMPAADGVETIGYKEIRYDMPDLENHLDFLRGRFRDSRFVFLTRDHDAVVRSGFYQQTDPALLRTYLTAVEQRFRGYTERNPDICFPITYQELTDFGRIAQLFRFIGHEVCENSWRAAVSTRHSIGTRSVVPLAAESNLVLFDSARSLIEASFFDVSKYELKHISQLALSGVLVPHLSSGAIHSLVFQNANTRHEAVVGLPSPGFGKKHPHNPLASVSRFSFVKDPPRLAADSGDFELVATFADAGRQILGRLYVSQRQGSIS
jgi:Sulfotransferase family